MPTFDVLPMDPVVEAFANPKQAQIAREYLGYISELKPGRMGRLRPGEGETLLAVRKRLGAAAKLSGKRLEIRQMKGEVYFWLRPPGPSARHDGVSFLPLKEQMEELLSELNPREARVLQLRLGVEDGRARTLEEVGEEFDLSRERVRQIQLKAMEKLRGAGRLEKLGMLAP